MNSNNIYLYVLLSDGLIITLSHDGNKTLDTINSKVVHVMVMGIDLYFALLISWRDEFGSAAA